MPLNDFGPITDEESAFALRGLSRRLDYRYEGYHGFLFFLSSLFFIGFWFAVYRYYSNPAPPHPAPPRTYYTTAVTRFSSAPWQNKSSVQNAYYAPQQTLGKPGGGDLVGYAAAADADYARKSMIPTAVAVEVNPGQSRSPY